MTNERIDILMTGVLEGTAPASDVARLNALLESDATLRREFAEMKRVHELLRTTPREAAPPDLRPTVMAAIRTPVRPVPARTSWLSSLGNVFVRRPAFGFGYAFAAGLAAGLFIYSLVSNPATTTEWRSPEQLSGSMTPRPSTTGSVETTDALPLAGGTVRVESRRVDSGTELVITSDAAESVDIEVRVTAGGETRTTQSTLPGRSPAPR